MEYDAAEEDDAAEQDDEEEHATDHFDMHFVLGAIIRMPNRLKYGPRKSEKEFVGQLVNLWRGKSFEDMRATFLPVYLRPLVDKWKAKLSAKKYAHIGLVWKLFADVNHDEFVQKLVPTPNTKGRYTRVTSTLYVSSPLLTLLLVSRSFSPRT